MKFLLEEKETKQQHVMSPDKMIELLLRKSNEKEQTKVVEELLIAFLSMPLSIEAIMKHGLAEMIGISFRLGMVYNRIVQQYNITIMDK